MGFLPGRTVGRSEKFSPLWIKEIDINLKGGLLWKTGSLEGSQTPPNIFRGGHVYPYLTQNTVGMGGFIFSVFDLS